jgi:adenosine/AMP kinase
MMLFTSFEISVHGAIYTCENTMKIVVATQNPLKTQAAKVGFEKMFP